MASNPSLTQRALKPAPPNDYTQALSAAMEAVGLAVNAKLQHRDDNFRFQEVGRLAKIGEALGRQLARGDLSVEGYVPPHRRPGCNVAGGVGMMYPHYGHGNLGGVDAEPLDDPPAWGQAYGDIRMNNPAARPQPAADDGNPMAFFREVLERIDGLNAGKKDERSSRDRTDLLIELTSLRRLLADENVDAGEREILEERRRQVMAKLHESNADSADDDDEEEDEDDTAAEQAQAIYCLNVACGVAHDQDWVGPDGAPLRCDVCNGLMAFAPVRAVNLGEQLAYDEGRRGVAG